MSFCLALSWIFKCVAVAVAVAVAVVVAVAEAVATDSPANKTWIFKCFYVLLLLVFFLHTFTENSKSCCDFKI